MKALRSLWILLLAVLLSAGCDSGASLDDEKATSTLRVLLTASPLGQDQVEALHVTFTRVDVFGSGQGTAAISE